MANQLFKTIVSLITSTTTREAVAIMEGVTESADHRLLVLKIRTTKAWETWAVCITNQITVSKGLLSTRSPKLTTKLNFASTSCKEIVLTMKNAALPTARQSWERSSQSKLSSQDRIRTTITSRFNQITMALSTVSNQFQYLFLQTITRCREITTTSPAHKIGNKITCNTKQFLLNRWATAYQWRASSQLITCRTRKLMHQIARSFLTSWVTKVLLLAKGLSTSSTLLVVSKTRKSAIAWARPSCLENKARLERLKRLSTSSPTSS